MHLPTHSPTPSPSPFNLVKSTTQIHKMGMKGHPQNNCGGGGSGGVGWTMKKKTAMVAVAMVVLLGVMGVMVVQRVRDRRLFNLVIKDKDRQIISLNLLLQKERQYAEENKRKNQDLNAKLFSLRTQKVELNNKIMEMRSTIGSMKDKHRALELAIEEKQNEIKRKESEIKDLKTNLQAPPSKRSRNPIDPSNHQVNLTARGSWFGQSSNTQKPNHQEIINSDVKVQNPKDEELEKLNNAKIEMHNTTNGTLATKEKQALEENGNESKPGSRFFIGATENDQSEKSQLKATPDEGPKVEADRMDDDKILTEVNMNSSRNGSEDQDYKEETED